jgi:hypothetical protein
MKAYRTNIVEGRGVVRLIPSEEGGRFVVRAGVGEDITGDTVVITGVKLDDLATIELGDPSPIERYIQPSSEAGEFDVVGAIAGSIVDIRASDTSTVAPDVQSFSEILS